MTNHMASNSSSDALTQRYGDSLVSSDETRTATRKHDPSSLRRFSLPL